MKRCSDEAAVHYRDEIFKGRRIAFSVNAFHEAWTLCVVVKDEPGYTPMPWQIANGPEIAMRTHADDLNDRILRLPIELANSHVSSSMRSVRP